MQRDVVERPRERRERGVRDVAGHVEHVGLAAGPGRDEPLREAAVVREQQQARRGLVEAADGAEPVERPSFFELCIVPRVPGRGFTIAACRAKMRSSRCVAAMATFAVEPYAVAAIP